MKKIIVAIDGSSGCGKSTTAKAVAKSLGYGYVDSGAMYRAVTLFLLRKGLNWELEDAVNRALQEIEISFSNINGVNTIFLNGENVNTDIRTPQVNAAVSPVSTLIPVRKEMVRQQQQMGNNRGIVMDGRDIGTVVFPDAELKIFMTASLDVRAIRRKAELLESGMDLTVEEIRKNLEERDRIDSSREEGPLKKAEGAWEIDTSNLTFDNQVSMIVERVKKLIS